MSGAPRAVGQRVNVQLDRRVRDGVEGCIRRLHIQRLQQVLPGIDEPTKDPDQARSGE